MIEHIMVVGFDTPIPMLAMPPLMVCLMYVEPMPYAENSHKRRMT